MTDEPFEGRRRFLTIAGAVGAAAIAAVLAVPGVGYLMDPLIRKRKGAGGWYDVGPTSVLRGERPVSLPVIGEQVDAWTRIPATRLGAVWLRKTKKGLVAFSAECPHLGCQVGWDDGNGRFHCPCHDAVFTLEGRVVSGPAPRPMDSLKARVKGGRVEVQFKRFRTQQKIRQEIG